MSGFLKRAGAICLMLALAATPALAADVEVRMLTKGETGKMVFEPALIKINPGDTVHFISVDKGHNAQTIKGTIPEGAEPFKSKTSKDFDVTLTVPGAYGVKCLPHFGLGMVALIVVGDDVHNLDAVKKAKMGKKSKARFADIIAGL